MIQDHPKPFLDHLEDLRWTLIKMGVALGLAMAIAFIFTRQILSLLYVPLKEAGLDPANFLKVLDIASPFTINLQIAFFSGLILALPFLLYFLAQFVFPALSNVEQRLFIPIFAIGTFLFLGGVAFCYFLILPQALRFFFNYSTELGFKAEWTIQNYIGFVVQMMSGFGLAFELPLLILALAKLGLVNAAFLSQRRRHAIVLIVIAAAVITPTSDLFTLALMSLPMWFLYEACVLICRCLERQPAKESESQSLV